MNNSLIPRYKQDRPPEDPNAEIFNLDEYCIQTNYPEKTNAAKVQAPCNPHIRRWNKPFLYQSAEGQVDEDSNYEQQIAHY